MLGNSWVTAQLAASEEGLSSRGLVTSRNVWFVELQVENYHFIMSVSELLLLPVSHWFPTCQILQLWRWRWHVSPKRRLISSSVTWTLLMLVINLVNSLPFCEIHHILVNSEAVGNNLKDRERKVCICNHSILYYFRLFSSLWKSLIRNRS
jgi:hypothetical protein